MRLFFTIKTLKHVKGGAERVFADVVSELARRGHEIIICTLDSEEGDFLYPVEESVKKVYLESPNADSRTGGRDFIKRVKQLRSVIKKYKPDVAVGFTHVMYVPLSIAMLGTGVPVLASEHIVPGYYKNRKFEYFLLWLSSHLVDRFSVLSKRIGSLYPASVRSKMVVIPNSVASASSLMDASARHGRQKTILNVGRLVDFKNQKTLIDAFAMLSESHPEWVLRIVGEGELRADLERQVSEYKLSDRVFLPGNTDKIDDEYNKAHIFVVPSLYEGFGLVTAEAASHGLPCVGFRDCLGTNELIEDGVTGMLVDSTDRAKSLAAAISTLMDNAELREQMGDAGKKSVLVYAPDRIYDRWEQVLRGLISDRC